MMGLDEALALVPGVYAANRWNFSLDQRISIRGFGARSSFGIRGVKVLLDGIPQTLPDGSGQLTNVELGAADRIEVLRGPSSALYGNASGGVISISSPSQVYGVASEQLRVTAGTFDRRQVPFFGVNDRTWSKLQSTTGAPVGPGYLTVVASRFEYGGQRQHSSARAHDLNARYVAALSDVHRLTVSVSYGDDPVADNPGALTLAELARNPDSAAAINLSRRAGKDVAQLQAGASLLLPRLDGGGARLAVFGVSRRLRNPQTFAWIDLDRVAYGARLDVTRPFHLGRLPGTLTAGIDLQRQRDDRLNVGNPNGSPDTVRQLDQLEHVTEIGPFVQAAVDLWPHTTITAGLRYDRLSFDVDDRLVTPSNPDDSGRRVMGAPSVVVGATHRHHHVMFYANVGTSFETPTTTELANRPDTAGGFNALLDPQRALNLEVGARGSFGNRVTLGLSVFRAGVRDALIASQISASPGRVFFQNAGRSRHQGVELEAGVRFTPGLRLDAAWTWSDFRYTAYTTRGQVLDGRRLPGIPEHRMNLVWRAQPAFARGAWLEIQQSAASGYLVDDTLQVRTATWHSVDVRAGIQDRYGRVRVSPFVALHNAFDRHYVSSVVINAANGRYYEPAPGRNVYTGLTISF